PPPLRPAAIGTTVRPRRPRRRRRVLLVLLGAVVAACGPGATGARGHAEVTIEDFEFLPPRLEVVAGTTVSWTNEDIFAHTVTSGTPRAPTGRFDGELGSVDSVAARGETVSLTFDEPGSYAYFCRLHPRMTATITVTP
ncbi:MAG: cupredoxin domain-containing protein, partial [Nitriliruptorales bacterium]